MSGSTGAGKHPGKLAKSLAGAALVLLSIGTGYLMGSPHEEVTAKEYITVPDVRYVEVSTDDKADEIPPECGYIIAKAKKVGEGVNKLSQSQAAYGRINSDLRDLIDDGTGGGIDAAELVRIGNDLSTLEDSTASAWGLIGPNVYESEKMFSQCPLDANRGS